MGLIDQGLQRIGVPVVTRPVLFEDLGSMSGAVAMYSLCFRQPIGSVNGAEFAGDDQFDAVLQRAWAALPAEPT
jgi:hypothetical protein